MIKAIIFDLSEVYLKGLKGAEKHIAPVLQIPEKKVWDALSSPELISFFHGQISEEDYLEAVIKKNKWDINIETLKKLIRKNFEEIEGTREIIEELKRRDYQLGLLSVHTKEWIEYCNKKFDYHKFFDSILYSFEVAVSKPDKRAYEMILKLGKKAEECLFIDDMEKNIQAAREMGINAIVFKNSSQLKKELKSYALSVE